MNNNEQIIEIIKTSLEDLREKLEEIIEAQNDVFERNIEKIEELQEQFEDDIEESLDKLEELQEMTDDEPEEIDPDELITELTSIKTSVIEKLKSTRELVKTSSEEFKKTESITVDLECEFTSLTDTVTNNLKNF